MLIDVLCGIFLLLFLLYGMRRGAFKEIVGVAALAAAIYAAVKLYDPAGRAIENLAGWPAGLSKVAGGLLVLMLVYFILLLVGRLGLKMIRKTPGEMVEEAAEETADQAYYDTKPGPITMLTNPLPKKEDFYYWFDKVLGGIFGVLKAALTYCVLFLVASTLADPGGPAMQRLESSKAFCLYRDYVDPALRLIPEYRLLASIRDLRHLVAAIDRDPERTSRALSHEEIQALGALPKVQELANDPEIREDWENRRFSSLLVNAKVWALLRDPEVRRRLSEVNYQRIIDSLNPPPPAAPTPPPAGPTPGTPSGSSPTPGTGPAPSTPPAGGGGTAPPSRP